LFAVSLQIISDYFLYPIIYTDIVRQKGFYVKNFRFWRGRDEIYRRRAGDG
jgi:hypothetical protein